MRLTVNNMPLWDRRGRVLNVYEELVAREGAAQVTFAVRVGPSKGAARANGWVHAYRLPAKEAEASRRRCRANAKKGPPKKETLFLAGWVVVFTSISGGVEVLPAPTAFVANPSANHAWLVGDLLPSSQAFDHTRVALHEHLGLLWYRLRR